MAENRVFFIPNCIRRIRCRGRRKNIAIPFGMEKLEWWGYQIVKKFDDTFSRFDRILAYDGQRLTDGVATVYLRYA